MPNRNLPYPESLQQAIDYYRRVVTNAPPAATETAAAANLLNEMQAMGDLDDACEAHSYDTNEVMQREGL